VKGKNAFLPIIALILILGGAFAAAPVLTSIAIADIGGFTSDSTPDITITDDASATGMELSCDGTNFKDWQAYATPVIDFNIASASYGCLNGGNGGVTVHLKLRNAASEVSEDKADTTEYD